MNLTEGVNYVGVIPSVRPATDVVNAFQRSHQRLPIQARTCNSVEGIRYCKNARSKWNYITYQASWISRAVPPFVMVPHERCYFSKRRVLSDHVRPNIRVPAHDFPLILRQRTGLVQYVVADSNLPKVMKRSCRSYEFALPVAKFKLLSDSFSEFRDTDRVRLRVTVASIHGLRGQIKGLVGQLRLALSIS